MAQRPHLRRLDESNRQQRDALKYMGAAEVRISQLAAEKDVLEKRCVAAASEEAQQNSYQAHTARPIDAASVEWLDAHVTPLLRSVNLLLDPRVDVVNDRPDRAAGRYQSRLDAGTRTSSTTSSTTSADNAASDQRLEGEAVQLEQDAEQALEVKAALRAAMSANVVIRCVSSLDAVVLPSVRGSPGG
jgi:hypothetical protein